MKVTLLGTGTSFPDKNRVQSGVLVETNSGPLLLDIGSGILHRLNQIEYPITTIENLFISHFHIDHCSDFLTFCQSLWMTGFSSTLHLFAPTNIRDWSRGLEIAFPYLLGKVHIESTSLDEKHVIQIGKVTITTAPTLHGSIESRAFRIEEDGRVVVYTSDTAPCPEVVELARGVDLLIHECNWLDGHQPKGVHSSPSDIMGVIEQTEPKKVILVHMLPEVIEKKDQVIRTVARRTNAEICVGEDLMSIEV